MTHQADLTGDLIALLGEEAFIAFVEKVGGTRFYVPRDPNASSDPFSIGFDVMASLAKEYGGLYIKVPLAKEMRARRMRLAGMTVREIALAMKMTESQIGRMMKAKPGRPKASPPKAQTNQLDMFD